MPKLDREQLLDGYRRLVKQLYTPRAYYQRILTFLRDYQPRGPKFTIQKLEIEAFCRSLWIMGIATRGRREYSNTGHS